MREDVIYDCPNAACTTPLYTGKCSKTCIERYNKEIGIKPMTNAERICANEHELATMLHAVKLGYAPWCDYHCKNEGDDGCDKCIDKWLKQPAE